MKHAPSQRMLGRLADASRRWLGPLPLLAVILGLTVLLALLLRLANSSTPILTDVSNAIDLPPARR